jgi:chromosome segregation ATPase
MAKNLPFADSKLVTQAQETLTAAKARVQDLQARLDQAQAEKARLESQDLSDETIGKVSGVALVRQVQALDATRSETTAALSQLAPEIDRLQHDLDEATTHLAAVESYVTKLNETLVMVESYNALAGEMATRLTALQVSIKALSALHTEAGIGGQLLGVAGRPQIPEITVGSVIQRRRREFYWNEADQRFGSGLI